jgi:hypothetical protein
MRKKFIYGATLILMFALGAGTMWVYLHRSSPTYVEEDPCADLIVVEQGVDEEVKDTDPLSVVDVEPPGDMPAEDVSGDSGVARDGTSELDAVAIEVWERLVKGYAEQPSTLTGDARIKQIYAFKESFDSLSLKSKVDSIHDALNLLSDGQVDFLAAIFLDSQEPEDVLESIYMDLLNRNTETVADVFAMVAENESHPLALKSREWLQDMAKNTDGE